MNNDLNPSPAPLERLSSGGQFLILLGIFVLSLVVFSLIGIVCIVMIGHVSLYDIKGMNDYSNPQLVEGLKVAQIISSFGTFIVPAVIFTLLVSRNRLEYLGMKNSGRLSTLLVGGLLMWGALPLINGMAELNSHMQLPSFMSSIESWMKNAEKQADALTEAFMGHQTFFGMLTNLFMIGLLAAVAEELFFRAVLQKIMIKWTKSVHWGVWLTGFLFSFLHFEFYGFLPRMLMGVYLGYLFIWSGSIWIPIFAHFLNNATAVIFAYIEDKGIVPKDIDQLGAKGSEIIYVVISAVFVALLMFLIYKMEHKKQEVISV